jgi:hypothetical protein
MWQDCSIGFCKFVTGWRVWNYCAEGMCTPFRIVLFWLTFKIPRRKLSGTLFHGVVNFLSLPFIPGCFVCYNAHRSHIDSRCLEEISRFSVRLKPPIQWVSGTLSPGGKQAGVWSRSPAPRFRTIAAVPSTPYAFKACTVTTLHASVTLCFSRTVVKHCSNKIIIVHVSRMLPHFWKYGNTQSVRNRYIILADISIG